MAQGGDRGPAAFRVAVSKKKSGELFWSEVILQRMVISGRERILLVRDITERKKAEQKIREEQQMLRQLLESQEQERRLIGFEIHDGLAQQLAGAIMQFQAFDLSRETDFDVAVQSHLAGRRMLDKALVETRRLIGGLRPVVLDESGVQNATTAPAFAASWPVAKRWHSGTKPRGGHEERRSGTAPGIRPAVEQ